MKNKNAKPSRLSLPPTLAAAIARQRYRKPPSDAEHRLQCACVRWFRLAHPALRQMLFAVPNGAFRNKATAVKLKAEGVTPGVSDLILLVPNRTYCALLIEMKTPEGRQSDSQRAWQDAVTATGRYAYVIARTVEQFAGIIEAYLNNEH